MIGFQEKFKILAVGAFMHLYSSLYLTFKGLSI